MQTADGEPSSHPSVSLRRLSDLPPRRLRLGAARFLYFAYGVFFVAYHLCYENVKNHTDGMEYLSDWTFILLGMVFGLLAMFSLQPSTAEAPQLVELTTAMHGVCWSSNIVSTAGAWYSFFFFPVCKSLEGVDNYPWCYLEWYRITEHALNMVFLFGDCFAGAVPVRRKDLGWSVIFLQCYAVYTWHRMFTTGKCAYIMFDFSTGWASIAWTNAAFVGIALAHVVTERLFALRDRRRQGGVGNVGRVGSDGSLPSHARYDALSNSD